MGEGGHSCVGRSTRLTVRLVCHIQQGITHAHCATNIYRAVSDAHALVMRSLLTADLPDHWIEPAHRLEAINRSKQNLA